MINETAVKKNYTRKHQNDGKVKKQKIKNKF
jgi:hypothetical protein